MDFSDSIVTEDRCPSRGARPPPTTTEVSARFVVLGSCPVHVTTGMPWATARQDMLNAVFWRSERRWISWCSMLEVSRRLTARSIAELKSELAPLTSVFSMTCLAVAIPPGIEGSHGSPALITQNRSSSEAASSVLKAIALSSSRSRISPTTSPLLRELSRTITVAVGACDPFSDGMKRRAPAPVRRSKARTRNKRRSNCLRRI